MCGIVGAVLSREVTPILLEGLKRMEYRGYDSAGIAVLSPEHELIRIRTQGKVAALVEAVHAKSPKSKIGIAHTRWATHGAPSEQNAHPHTGGDGNELAVVHNGIIENFETLKQSLIAKGYTFRSETDSEVIAHLIDSELKGGLSLKDAVLKATAQLKGAYALGVIHTQTPDRLIAVRRGSPLVLGLGIEENYFASDHLALLPVTQRFIYLQEGDLAEVFAKKIDIYNEHGESVKRDVKSLSQEMFLNAHKGRFRHYMLKEIYEQPQAIANTLEGRLSQDGVFEQAFGHEAPGIFKRVKQVQIVACGTSYHAGLVAKYWIEQLVRIPVQVEVASEFRYRDTIVLDDTLFVVISQSGETADTLAALHKAKEAGYLSTLAICNVPESAMVREADLTLLTRAGPEIGVASTKAFTTQLVGLALLALSLAKEHGVQDLSTHVQSLRELPRAIEQVLQYDEMIARTAQLFADKTSTLFVGRGVFFPIVLEGALKLKEISYIHAEAYPAGELKHGPLALVDPEMPVVALLHDDALAEKTLSNLQEIKARGGQLVIFTDVPNVTMMDAKVTSLQGVQMSLFTAPILFTLPMQLLSYHVAILKGTDVDQPRNLAKSVTVE